MTDLFTKQHTSFK